MPSNLEQLAKNVAGKFIVLDGPDGAGKSTQRQLLADALSQAGVDVVCCRDPGGTTIGDRIRSVLLDFDLSSMAVGCETMLFMASRAQLVHEVIAPALSQGKTVLCDRFVTSTCAYQGAAGYDPQRVIELARFAIGDVWPHVTLIFDINVDEGFKRVGRNPKHAGKNRKQDTIQKDLIFADGAALPDAMEARPIDFHRQVRKMFLSVHEYYPTPVLTIDGSGETQQVHELAVEALSNVLA